MKNFKLGKLPKKFDARTLQLARYLQLPKLPMPPLSIDHATLMPMDIGMMGNDVYGDCTIAAAGHMVQSWSTYAQRGTETIADADIIAAYKIISPNDTGAYLLDALNLWKNTGIGKDKIEAFVEVSTGNLTEAKLAIQYFGSLYIGMSLPDTNTFGPWDVKNPTWAPNPYNGHAVCLIGYNDATQMFKVCTWGEIWDMSYDWYMKYCDEAYAVLNDIELIESTGLSPEGFNYTTLQEDLSQIGDPVSPTPDPVPPAPVPPAPVPPAPTPPDPSNNGGIVLIAVLVVVALILIWAVAG